MTKINANCRYGAAHNESAKAANSNLYTSGRPSLASKLLTYLMIGLMLVTNNVSATTIIADSSAGNQKPTITHSTNGTTQVDIREASRGGVSHNKYNQFDVSNKGVILNNSTNITQTQLGGYVEGNKNLKRGSADIILNEVNSRNISQLAGYIEVAGKKAQVIVANASGIICNGCGFINASRGTLTTGKPIMENGYLKGYRVEGGHIRIEGKGLDSAVQDFTDLIARSVSINAGIWAQELSVIAGKNLVSTDLKSIKKLVTKADDEIQDAPPEFAIDVAALGGMYAGKIQLIGTEHGVGVRNAGKLGATAGHLTISSDGRLINSGRISSSQKIDLKANRKKGSHLQNTGVIDSKELVIEAGTIENAGKGKVFADNITLSADTLDNKGDDIGSPVIAARVKLNVAVNVLNNMKHALLLSEGDFNIGKLIDDLGDVTGFADSVNNHSSTLESKGDFVISSHEINNIDDEIKTEEIELVELREYIKEWAFIDSPDVRYKTEEVEEFCVGCGGRTNYRKLRVKKTGMSGSKYNYYDFTRKYYTDIAVNKAPAKIVSGTNLTINAGHVLNENSNITAGKNLNINADIENKSIAASKRTEDIGNRYYTYDYTTSVGFPKKTAHYSSTKKQSYHPIDIKEDIDLKIPDVKEHDNVATTELNLNDKLEHLNSLYEVNPSNNNYLIETDSRFTNKNEWLSSDYMFKKLKSEPDNIQKRLGDGYYEQNLIKEQIASLTGQRYTGDYNSDSEQYEALMNNGAEFANNHNLTLGVELTPEQIEALDSDIVWMVSKKVTVNGHDEDVLVPQVYIANQVIVSTGGAVISAKNAQINSTGSIKSSGQIVTKESLNINAKDIENKGVIQGDKLNLNAKNDITSNGTLAANSNITLNAGNNVNLVSETRTEKRDTSKGKQGFLKRKPALVEHDERTDIKRVSTVAVGNGSIQINAGNDINAAASLIQSKGDTSINAGNDLNIKAVDTRNKEEYIESSDNYLKSDITKGIGSQIGSTDGNVKLTAGKTLNAEGATVSAKDTVSVNANDINITAANASKKVDAHIKTKSSNAISKSESTYDLNIENHTLVGSTFGGDNVDIKAKNNATIVGSDVLAGNKLTIESGGDTTVKAGEESYYHKEKTVTKSSGLSSGGGFGISVGSNKETNIATDTEQGYKQSNLSSMGDVSVKAGHNATVKNSNIDAEKDVHVVAQNVNITADDAKAVHKNEHISESSGFTLALTGSAIDTYQSVKNAKDTASNDDASATSSVLAALKAQLALVKAAQSTEIVDADGQSGPSVAVKATFGKQKTVSKTTTESSTSQGSSLNAKGNINLVAKGDGSKDSGDINIVGSTVAAEGNTNVFANHDLNVKSGLNTQHTDSSTKTTGGATGVQAGIGGGESGLRYVAEANYSKEKEHADGSYWTESSISGKNLTVKTGNDANIIGGTLNGDKVTADIGNDLNIQSVQASDDFGYKKKSGSISGTYGSGASLSLSIEKTEMKSDWKSVLNQSGIKAGNDGFDVTVGGNTDIKGAVISSSAEDASKNRLDTDSLTMSDINNSASYNVSYSSISGAMSTDGPTSFGSTSYYNRGKDSNTTKSAISNGNLTVRDKASKNPNTINHDTKGAFSALGTLFDKQKEMERMENAKAIQSLAADAKEIANNADRISAQNKVNEELKKVDLDKGSVSHGDYYNAVNAQITENANKGNTTGGVGGTFNNVVDGVASMSIGILTGNMIGGVAGAIEPWAIDEIKYQTGKENEKGEWETTLPTIYILSSAALGSVVTSAQSGPALSGFLGGGAPPAWDVFLEVLAYFNKKSELTES